MLASSINTIVSIQFTLPQPMPACQTAIKKCLPCRAGRSTTPIQISASQRDTQYRRGSGGAMLPRVALIIVRIAHDVSHFAVDEQGSVPEHVVVDGFVLGCGLDGGAEDGVFDVSAAHFEV